MAKKTKPKPCPYCKGKGWKIRVVMQADNEEYVKESCVACLGTGKAR